MRRILWFFLLCALAGGLPAQAQAPAGQQEALQWLQRAATAAGKLSYSGTFVFRDGRQSETSRIVHVASGGIREEKIEVRDGSPREIITRNDEVKCYLPESKRILVEQGGAKRLFPSLMPAGLLGLTDHYALRKGERARIAGFDSQVVRLDPRDAFRYGHQFWIEVGSGLLLRADMLGEQGDLLESLAFTELKFGAPVNVAEALRPGFPDATAEKGNWEVRKTKSRDLRDETRWQFRADLPGFKRQAAMVRTLAQESGRDAVEELHWIYSDGLAALSVFIRPLRTQNDPFEASVHSIGAISVAKRVVDGHQVVVMGDVPLAAVRRFAEGIEVRVR